MTCLGGLEVRRPLLAEMNILQALTQQRMNLKQAAEGFISQAWSCPKHDIFSSPLSHMTEMGM